MDLEYRYLPAEVRFDTDEQKFRGYAAVFNSLSKDLGGFKEVIRRGAFANTLSAGKEIRCLIDHEPQKLLASTANGSLTVREDQRGLYFESQIPDTSYARDAAELVRRGLMSACSFGFYPRTSKGSFRKENNLTLREWTELDVFDCSIVFNPAYAATSVSLRSYEEWLEEQKNLLSPKQVDRWIQLAEIISNS